MEKDKHFKIVVVTLLVIISLSLLFILASFLVGESGDCATDHGGTDNEVNDGGNPLINDIKPEEKAILVTDHEEAAFIYEFFRYTEYREVADIITAMSILETGWYRSGMHQEKQNYFSTKKRKCLADNEKCYTQHRDIDASCRFVLNGVFRKRGYRVDREGFLLDIIEQGYAEDPNYIKKVQGVLKRLEKNGES